jgi:Tol biopolymer transport system component
MSIDVGSRIGAYEVLALIGEGGMGRVFRARDTRLKREVAVKALPPDVAADEDRIARFRREAEALAALNHPHIAAIHDVVEAGGSQFLVMEFVDGDTIADRIRRGPMPVAEALRAGAQVAEALEAAHARGIVHRDLKPANIKITPAGEVKVLDFGLAKDLDAEASQAGRLSLANSPTVAGGGTAAGVILGTAAYMSPEQARGQRVDTQSDVWALGCVLFEMLTGRQSFMGHTVTDVLAAVVRGEPDWSALPADTPAGVRSLLRRCLQKDPSRRLHHVADARIELEEAQADAGAPMDGATRKRPASPRWAWVAMIALGLLAVGLSVALALALRPVAAPPEMRVEINTPPSTDPIYLAISPDGQKLAFVAAADGISRLWLRSLDGTSTQPLAGTELARAPFWSPDGRSLGFFADGKLKRIDINGGLTRTLAGAPIGVGGTWSREGVIVFAPAAGALLRVPAAGGEAVPATRLDTGESSHRFPQFLPDDRHFLFYVRGTPEKRGIYLGSLDGSAPRRLLDSDSQGVIAASGHVLFVRQGTLFAQKLTDRLALSAEPFAVADRVAFDSSLNVAAITASAAGALAYRSGAVRGQRQLVWFDRSGTRTGAVGAVDASGTFNPDLSPDGRSLTINRTVEFDQDVWLIDMARGVLRRFSFDPGIDQLPVWSNDGTRIVFSSNRKNAYDLYQKPAGGPGSETLLLETSQNKFAMGFSADGRFLLYRNTAENTNWDLWALPLEGDRKPFPVVQTNFQEMMGEFAPDGKWIAYQSNESGQFEIYAQSFPVPGAPLRVSTAGGAQPRWRRDGKELFYIAFDGRLMAAPIKVDARGQLQTGSPVPLFVTHTAGGAVPSPQKQQYVVSLDGQSFLINSLTDEASTLPITLVLNWKPVATR